MGMELRGVMGMELRGGSWEWNSWFRLGLAQLC